PKKKEAEKGQSDEKAEEKDQEYKQVNITYSYPSEDEDKPPKEKPFLYTGYEVWAPGGIKVRVQNGRSSASIFVVHNTPEGEQYIRKRWEMYCKSVSDLFSLRGLLK